MNAVLLTLVIAGCVNDSLNPQQLQISVVICKGDPLGSRAEGTLKYLAEPLAVTQSGRPAHFRTGGAEAVLGGSSGVTGPGVQLNPAAVEVEVLPISGGFGRIWVEIGATHRETRPGLGLPGQPSVVEQSLRTKRSVTLGEKFRIRIAAASPESQTWAEVTVIGLLLRVRLASGYFRSPRKRRLPGGGRGCDVGRRGIVRNAFPCLPGLLTRPKFAIPLQVSQPAQSRASTGNPAILAHGASSVVLNVFDAQRRVVAN